MNRESYFKDKDANIGVTENTENNTLDTNFSKEKSMLFLFAFVIIAVIGIVYVKDKFLSNYFKNSNPLSVNTEQGGGYLETYDPIRNANEDSDGDGVSNWREVVGGTDPEDKTSLFGNTESKTILVTATTSLTELAANDLLVLSKYKERYPDMNVDSLTSGLADNYEKLILPDRVIDINTADSKDLTYLKSYGNFVASMFLFIFLNDEFVEIKEAAESPATFSKTKIYLSDLSKICEAQKIIKNVPFTYSELHKDFIYNCELYVNALSGMTSLDKDKVRFIISLNKQEEAVRNIITNFNNYSDRLRGDGVFFKSSENGYMFINKIN